MMEDQCFDCWKKTTEHPNIPSYIEETTTDVIVRMNSLQ